MKVMYKVQTLAEHAKKQKESKAKKAPTRNEINDTHDEINDMVVENIKKSVKEIFETHVETLKKRSCRDTDSNGDLENEHYHMEDANF